MKKLLLCASLVFSAANVFGSGDIQRGRDWKKLLVPANAGKTFQFLQGSMPVEILGGAKAGKTVTLPSGLEVQLSVAPAIAIVEIVNSDSIIGGGEDMLPLISYLSLAQAGQQFKIPDTVVDAHGMAGYINVHRGRRAVVEKTTVVARILQGAVADSSAAAAE